MKAIKAARRYTVKARKVQSIRGNYSEYDIWDSKYNSSYGSQTPSREAADKLCNWLNEQDVLEKTPAKSA